MHRLLQNTNVFHICQNENFAFKINKAMNELSRPARIRFDVLNENHNAL